MIRRTGSILPLLLALALLAAAPLRAADDAGTDFERWYAVILQGNHAGWYVEKKQTAGRRITSSQHMVLTVLRGSTPLQLEVATTFTESQRGRPISALNRQRVGQTIRERRLIFERGGGIRVITRQGDREEQRRLDPVRGDWLTPAEASRHVSEQLNAGNKKFSFKTFDPATSSEPVEVGIELLGEQVIDVYGRKVPAIKRSVAMSNLPNAHMVEYVDEEGRMLRTTMALGNIEMELLAADKQLAMAPADPPELLATTLIRPDFRIDRPRRLRRAGYRLALRSGELPDLPDSAVQRVERLDGRTAAIHIDVDRPTPSAIGVGGRPAPQPGEASGQAGFGSAGSAADEPPAVRHTPMIDGRDPEIIALAERADPGPDRPAAERAEALRRFVGRHIQSVNLSVGLASASEVARARVGDCTEHAVLLAAMLNAADIPARVASGLIYVPRFAGREHVFGYHMWTQAWTEGRWTDLDATLPHGTPFDAAHILLSTSHLEDGHLTNDMITLAPLIGRLTIERLPPAANGGLPGP